MITLPPSLRRAVAVVLVAPLLATAPAQAAVARVRATGTLTVTTRVATWSAVAVPRDADPTRRPLVLVWSIEQGTAQQYVDIVNTGTVPLGGQRFNVVSAYERSPNVRPPTITFDACLGGSWTSAGTCTGSTVRLGSTSAASFTTVDTPLDPGARYSVRASTAPGAIATYTTTLDVVVGRAQIRRATADRP